MHDTFPAWINGESTPVGLTDAGGAAGMPASCQGIKDVFLDNVGTGSPVGTREPTFTYVLYSFHFE